MAFPPPERAGAAAGKNKKKRLEKRRFELLNKNIYLYFIHQGAKHFCTTWNCKKTKITLSVFRPSEGRVSWEVGRESLRGKGGGGEGSHLRKAFSTLPLCGKMGFFAKFAMSCRGFVKVFVSTLDYIIYIL